VNTLFVPHLTRLRGTKEFEAHGMILLTDNCSSPTSDEVVAVFTRERMKLIISATHTTHIFQILDIVLFRALKKHDTGLTALEEEGTTAAFMIKI
jgi:flagellar motor component MotA